MKKINVLLSIYFILLPIANAAPPELLNQNIQNLIDQERIKCHIPALSVSVKLPNQDKIYNYVSGTTRLNGKDKFSENNLFQIGSITKSFTAAIALQLEAEGKLDIDMPIRQWLAQYPEWQTITVRQLLNQTSGIYNYAALPDFKHNLFKHPTHQWTLTELANLAYSHKPNLNFKPGSNWGYSNTNYILVAMIIESVTGHSFIDEIRQRLLGKKYGLLNTYYLQNYKDLRKRMVHGYEGSIDTTDINPSWGASAGALISNSYDIALWVEKLFNGTVLPKKQLNEMMQLVSMQTGKPIYHSMESGYGVGVGSDFESAGFNKKYGRVYDHSGGMRGYYSYFIYLPKYHLIVSLTASKMDDRSCSVTRIADDVIKLVLDTGG